jgi:hypothetical protein
MRAFLGINLASDPVPDATIINAPSSTTARPATGDSQKIITNFKCPLAWEPSWLQLASWPKIKVKRAAEAKRACQNLGIVIENDRGRPPLTRIGDLVRSRN